MATKNKSPLVSIFKTQTPRPEIPRQQRQRRQNGGFFGHGREREPGPGFPGPASHISVQSPEREPCRHQVEMDERALREEDWIQRSANCGGNRDFSICHLLRQAKKAKQRKRCGQEHGGAAHNRRVAGDLPPQRQIGQHQRRMSIGCSGVRNQASTQQQIARSRHVVSRLVPEIRQPHQGRVQRQKHRKGQGKDEHGLGAARGVARSSQSGRGTLPAASAPDREPSYADPA